MSLSVREKYLMTAAFSAGAYYTSLEEWLSEPLGVGGSTVADLVDHEASNPLSQMVALGEDQGHHPKERNRD